MYSFIVYNFNMKRAHHDMQCYTCNAILGAQRCYIFSRYSQWLVFGTLRHICQYKLALKRKMSEGYDKKYRKIHCEVVVGIALQFLL